MSELETSASADTLIKMLQRQRALIGQLDGLAERQGALIEGGNSDALLALLTQRQQIMDQFVAGQDDMTRLSEACMGGTVPIDDATRDRIGVLIDDISHRLATIMELDEQARARLESNRDSAGQALLGLSAARAARDAYVNARAVNNRFADRRG